MAWDIGTLGGGAGTGIIGGVYHHSEESKNKISKAMKGEKNPFYGCHHSKETKRKISKANKGTHRLKETRERMSKAKIGEKNSSWKGGKVKTICQICGKEKQVKQYIIKNGKGKFCSYKCCAIYKMIHQKKHNTDIERLLENELIRRNILYTKQVPLLGITIVDFLLPPNIVIYADGGYWHNLPHVKKRDRNQDFILLFYGYKIFRFTDKEIKKSAKKCINKMEINNGY